MHLRLVEVKNDDLFVVYDVDNGGVCCCSRYTLMRLISEYKQQIEGVTLGKRNLEIQEVGLLDGKLRMRKAPVICEDETKRSAVTIMKGLDAKHYPRIKVDRRGDGDLVKIKYNNRVILGIQVGQGEYLLEDFVYVSRRKTALSGIGDVSGINTLTGIEGIDVETYSDATEKEKQYMQQLKVRFEEVKELIKASDTRVNVMEQQINAMRKKIEVLTKQINEEKDDCKKKSKAIAKFAFGLYNDRRYAGITGEELGMFSFRGSVQGNLIPYEAIPYVLKRTKRKILYTDVRGYSLNAIYREPITKEQALQIYEKRSYMDFDATDSDYIHITTYLYKYTKENL